MFRHNHAVVFASGMYKTEGAWSYRDYNDWWLANQLALIEAHLHFHVKWKQ